MMPATVINYIAWYIFVFISVMWVLVLIRNRKTFSEGKLTGNFPIVSIMDWAGYRLSLMCQIRAAICGPCRLSIRTSVWFP